MIESLLFSRRILVAYPCFLTLLSIIDEIMNSIISFSFRQKITHDKITRDIILQHARRQFPLLHKITSVIILIKSKITGSRSKITEPHSLKRNVGKKRTQKRRQENVNSELAQVGGLQKYPNAQISDFPRTFG